jgi:uncharacterized protein (TIGR02246 family)
MRELLIFCACIFALVGCQSSKKADIAKEEAALRAVDAQWQEAVKSRDAEKVAAFWADDAIIYPSGGTAIRGKAAIRDYVKGALASPDFNITWQADSVAVAASGDLAYETAHDEITFRSPAGQLMKENTNAVVIWKKQANGSWKAIVDIWTPQAPPK